MAETSCLQRNECDLKGEKEWISQETEINEIGAQNGGCGTNNKNENCNSRKVEILDLNDVKKEVDLLSPKKLNKKSESMLAHLNIKDENGILRKDIRKNNKKVYKSLRLNQFTQIKLQKSPRKETTDQVLGDTHSNAIEMVHKGLKNDIHNCAPHVEENTDNQTNPNNFNNNINFEDNNKGDTKNDNNNNDNNSNNNNQGDKNATQSDFADTMEIENSGSPKGSRRSNAPEIARDAATKKAIFQQPRSSVGSLIGLHRPGQLSYVHIEHRLSKTITFVNDSRAWSLPESEDVIIMTPNPTDDYQIRAATVEKLVEKLTTLNEKQSPAHNLYIKIFFMTYRSFADPVAIFDLLQKRYMGPELFLLKDSNFSVIVKARKCVCLVISHWFTEHFLDFSFNQELMKRLHNFMATAKQMDPTNKYLKNLDFIIEKKINTGSYTSLFDASIMIDNKVCPEPILPKDLKNFTFLDLDDEEIARQLTIGEYHRYSDIQPVELQDLAWSKPALKSRSPNILEMINRFNKFSRIFSSLIVLQPRIRERKNVIKKLISIANHLLKMNSFNMVMSVMSGFGNSAIYRLKHSFASLDKKSLDLLQHFNEILSTNQSYKAYRDMTANLTPPAIPFLGVYLSDLTFVDEGNPDKVQSLVNFRKRQLEYDVIIQVLKFKGHTYNFKIVPRIVSFLDQLTSLDDSQLYKLSLECEPRNSKRKDIK